MLESRTIRIGVFWPTAVLLLALGGCARDPQATRAHHSEKARRYASEGKIAEAIIEYRNALAADPQSGDTHLSLGEAYLRLGDAGNAARALIRAADLLPDRVDVQLKAGNLLLLGGRFDDAKVRAEKALAVAPRDIDSHILLANALAGLKNLDAAVTQIEEAISLDPARAATYTNLGAIEVGRGRSQAAEEAFRKAVALNDASPAAHLAIANFYWVSGRMAEAEKELKRALSIEPGNVVAQRAMAGFFIATNRPGDAEIHMKKVWELTNSPTAALALADLHVARNDERSARQILESLKDNKEATAYARLRLASLDHAAGRRDQAYAQVEDILKTDGRNVQALLVKSSLLLADRRTDDALATVDLALTANADSVAAYNVLGRVQAARNQTEAAIAAYENVLRLNPRATSAQVALAQLHLAAGRSQASAGFAEDALKREPANPDARLALVRSLIARGELQRAAPELEQLSSRFPNSTAVLVQDGILHARRKNIAPARKSFERALKLDPRSAEALAGLIALDLAANQPAVARARVDAEVERADVSLSMLMLAARTCFATGDRKTAEQYFRRVLERDPTYLQAYVALGQLYVIDRRLDAALAEFEALAQRDPRPVAPLTFAGVILQAQGKTADAQDRFERALQVDPAAAVAANNLAWIYAESGGNLDVALQLAQTAHSKLPETPEVNDTLGFIYYKKNLLPQSVTSLRAAVDKDPAQATYHYHLGLALAKSGDGPAATEHLARALSLKADFNGANEARAVLETLKTR